MLVDWVAGQSDQGYWPSLKKMEEEKGGYILLSTKTSKLLRTCSISNMETELHPHGLAVNFNSTLQVQSPPSAG
jgi:hypothetical protein